MGDQDRRPVARLRHRRAGRYFGGVLYFIVCRGARVNAIAAIAGLRHSVSSEMVPVLRAARDLLIERLQVIEGSSVEDNRFSVSVHWRNCAVDDRPAVEAIVDSTLSEAPFAGVLRKNSGKCVYELRPDVKWDKGEAVLYLLELLRRRETDFDFFEPAHFAVTQRLQQQLRTVSERTQAM